MPEDHDPVPYSDQFSTDRIFTKRITQRQQLNWQSQPSSQAMTNLKFGETFVASFSGCGSMWRRFVWHDPNSAGLENTMSLRDSENRSIDEIQLEDDDTGQLNFNIAVPADGIGYKPHGDQLVCGRTLKTKYANASWVWLDGVPNPTSGKESKFTFAWPATPATINACSFKIVGWRGGKFSYESTVTFAQGDSTRSKDSDPITDSDYYTVFYESSVEDDTNFDANGIKISITSFCSQLAHVQVQDAWKNATMLGRGCMRATSLRMTEMAAPLNIEGECSVSCTRENGTWWEMYNQGQGGAGSVFKVNTNYRDAYLGPLRLGGYGYGLPKDMEDFRPKDYIVLNYSTGVIIDVFFDLEDTRTVTVFTANTLNTGANDGLTGLGADCWLTVATHFDGTCDNRWVDMWYPNVSFEVRVFIFRKPYGPFGHGGNGAHSVLTLLTAASLSDVDARARDHARRAEGHVQQVAHQGARQRAV